MEIAELKSVKVKEVGGDDNGGQKTVFVQLLRPKAA